MIEAKVIADSISNYGFRITTVQLIYHRFIHGELLTHRAFSRSSMSSRAIPVAKMIEQVRNAPAMPLHWGLNQPGMGARSELGPVEMEQAKALWLSAAENAARTAEAMNQINLAKQVANRVLEPFQWMRTVVTATEWDNFFELRCHPDAQPEFQALALEVRNAMGESKPVPRAYQAANAGWHLPYVTEEERVNTQSVMGSDELEASWLLAKVSSARCARVSYNRHDNTAPSLDDDMALFERLAGSRPLHASPLEHSALAASPQTRSGNLRGWDQFRTIYGETIGA